MTVSATRFKKLAYTLITKHGQVIVFTQLMFLFWRATVTCVNFFLFNLKCWLLIWKMLWDVLSHDWGLWWISWSKQKKKEIYKDTRIQGYWRPPKNLSILSCFLKLRPEPNKRNLSALINPMIFHTTCFQIRVSSLWKHLSCFNITIVACRQLHKEPYSQLSVGEFDWAERRSDLSPVQHLECCLRLPNISVGPHWCCFGSMKSRFFAAKSKGFPEELKLLQQHINAHGFGMRCLTINSPHTFRQVMSIF